MLFWPAPLASFLGPGFSPVPPSFLVAVSFFGRPLFLAPDVSSSSSNPSFSTASFLGGDFAFFSPFLLPPEGVRREGVDILVDLVFFCLFRMREKMKDTNKRNKKSKGKRKIPLVADCSIRRQAGNHLHHQSPNRFQ